jgi:hypothetical protein
MVEFRTFPDVLAADTARRVVTDMGWSGKRLARHQEAETFPQFDRHRADTAGSDKPQH